MESKQEFKPNPQLRLMEQMREGTHSAHELSNKTSELISWGNGWYWEVSFVSIIFCDVFRISNAIEPSLRASGVIGALIIKPTFLKRGASEIGVGTSNMLWLYWKRYSIGRSNSQGDGKEAMRLWYFCTMSEMWQGVDIVIKSSGLHLEQTWTMNVWSPDMKQTATKTN